MKLIPMDFPLMQKGLSLIKENLALTWCSVLLVALYLLLLGWGLLVQISTRMMGGCMLIKQRLGMPMQDFGTTYTDGQERK